MDRLYERIKSEVLWEPWAERDYFQWRRDRRLFRGRSDGWSGLWRMDIIWIWVKGQSDHQGSETETQESTAWFWGTGVIAISPSTHDIQRRQHWKGREPTVPWIPGREAFMLIHRQWAREWHNYSWVYSWVWNVSEVGDRRDEKQLGDLQ